MGIEFLRCKNGISKWYLKPLTVILALFFVLGPVGLPLLYRSPHFGKTSKIILTVAVLVYTAYLTYVSLELIRALLETMGALLGSS
jgi:hypothetical protein